MTTVTSLILFSGCLKKIKKNGEIDEWILIILTTVNDIHLVMC
jgi:hypothetical protein